VNNRDDLCPDSTHTNVNLSGCTPKQADEDDDGIADAYDQCNQTIATETIDQYGCGINQQSGIELTFLSLSGLFVVGLVLLLMFNQSTNSSLQNSLRRFGPTEPAANVVERLGERGLTIREQISDSEFEWSRVAAAPFSFVVQALAFSIVATGYLLAGLLYVLFWAVVIYFAIATFALVLIGSAAAFCFLLPLLLIGSVFA